MMKVHQYPDCMEITVPCYMNAADQLTININGSDGSVRVAAEMGDRNAYIYMTRDVALRLALVLLGKVAR